MRISNLLIVFGFLISGVVSAAPPGPRAIPVVVEEAQVRPMAPVVWSVGSVVSRYDARMASEVAGRLLDVAEEGQYVETKGTLARIDDTLTQADMKEAEAVVAREKANLKFLRREVQRLKRLATQNNAAQTKLEQTQAEHDASVNELEAAKARLQIARERLARSELRAPFAGVVVARLKRSGEWVNSGDEVVHLVDPERLEVESTAPLHLKPYLKPGLTIELKSSEGHGLGKIRAVVPVADTQSRLLRLRLDIIDGSWAAGQPLRLALPTAHSSDVLTVSRDALVLRRSGAYLFTVGADGSAQRVDVKTGMAVGPYIEVRGGLKAGDKVVIRGNERLRPGQSVKVITGTTL